MISLEMSSPAGAPYIVWMLKYVVVAAGDVWASAGLSVRTRQSYGTPVRRLKSTDSRLSGNYDVSN